MTDMGRRAGGGDMYKSVYDPNDDGVIAVAQTQADMTKAVYDPVLNTLVALAASHATQHQNGGSDEISLVGMTLPAHKTTHQNGGADEIDATGLTGIPVGAILGDGGEGRTLRHVQIKIDDGSAASTIKIWIGAMWNATGHGWTADIGKGATVGDWTLNATGTLLTWTPSGDYGNLYALSLYNYRNQSNLDQYISGYMSGASINFYLIQPTASSTYDWTLHVDTGDITMFLFIITQS